VNIRALQAFDAATTLIAAQAGYFGALANYDAATGDLAEQISRASPATRSNDG
jgi:hypothetical protein